MKKLLLLAAFAAIQLVASAQTEYWFQQGFEVTKPDGWTVNCGTTSSTGVFAGANGAKLGFNNSTDGGDAANAVAKYAGQDKNLLSPTVANAGELTFYIKVNSTKIDGFTLHVQTVKSGVATDIWSDVINKDHGYDATLKLVKVPVNSTESVAINFYAEQTRFDFSDGTATRAYMIIDDIALSKNGTGVNPDEPDSYLERLTTDFTDEATWSSYRGGTPLTTTPSGGGFTSSATLSNGWSLTAADYVAQGSATCEVEGADNHKYRLAADTPSKGGMIETPYVKSCSTIEVHASHGKDLAVCDVQAYVNGAWQSVGKFATKKAGAGVPDTHAVFEVNSTEPVKFRLVNTTGKDANNANVNSTMYIWNVTTTPAPNSGIDAVEADSNATVNVYNLQGALLRKSVPAAEASQNLAPGLYVIGGKKVVVK